MKPRLFIDLLILDVKNRFIVGHGILIYYYIMRTIIKSLLTYCRWPDDLSLEELQLTNISFKVLFPAGIKNSSKSIIPK